MSHSLERMHPTRKNKAVSPCQPRGDDHDPGFHFFHFAHAHDFLGVVFQDCGSTWSQSTCPSVH